MDVEAETLIHQSDDRYEAARKVQRIEPNPVGNDAARGDDERGCAIVRSEKLGDSGNDRGRLGRGRFNRHA
jgi:hypothetical protein